MKLTEEKKMMLLGVISMLIVLVVLLIQIADTKISEYNSKIIFQQNNLNLQLGRGYHALLNNYFYRNYGFFISALNPKIEIDSTSSDVMNPTHFLNADSNNVIRSDKWEMVKRGELSESEYFYQMSDLYCLEYEKIYEYYHIAASEYMSDITLGTVWKTWKRVFIVVLFILIFINLWGYYVLFKSIRRRVKS